MIIVKMWGGLGNQMFIYSLYRSLLERKRNVKIDMSYFEVFDAHNGYELENIFGIKLQVADRKESEKFANIGFSLKDRLIRFFFTPKTQFIPRPEDAIKFFPEVFEMDNMYLQGYWQREEYFKNIKEKIREDFSFKASLSRESVEFKEKIEKTNAVSIHVRRGDYISNKLPVNNILSTLLNRKNRLNGVCTAKYYDNSIKYIDSKIENPVYFIFSNDILWCKSHFNLKNMEFVDCNKEKNSYQDMYLMSLCRHNIIANSSFSWWAAWLNKNKEKIVVTPEKWFSSSYNMHCALDEWVKIGIY